MRLRRAAPRARIAYICDTKPPRGFPTMGIETLTLPLDVNALVELAQVA
jgi:hypothetical protein